MYMHSLDNEPPTRPRCKPSTFAFWATTGPNEPSGLGILHCQQLASPTECILIKKTQLIGTRPYIYPCRDPWEALQEPSGCTGGARPISLTPYGPRQGPVTDTCEQRAGPGKAFNEMRTSPFRKPGRARRDPPELRLNIFKHDFIMTTVYSARGPPGTKIPAALTA